MDGRVGQEGVSRRKYDIGFYVCNNASTPAVRIVRSEARMQSFSSSCLFRHYFFQFRGIGSRESASCSLCELHDIFLSSRFIAVFFIPVGGRK